MGLETETARFLLSSRRAGTRFTRCVTLGRQNLFLGNRELALLMQEYGFDPTQSPRLFATAYTRFRYSEEFWEMMGTTDLVTLDASAYEGATRVHDLNQPIPEDLKARFDAVCDLGTLEHVFNFPQALKNCLEMVSLGGHFLSQTPANNHFGHGFYQFSPELFHRVLGPQNGFTIERMLAVEYGPRHRWFEVADPAIIKARVALINSFPVMLFIRAKRTELKPILATTPQQSDCAAQWANQAEPAQNGVVDRFASPRFDRMKVWLLEKAPGFARMIESLRFSPLNWEWTFRNRKTFRRIPPEQR